MKNIKILTVVLLAIGIAGMGIGCGSSSGGSSGSQVSSGVNSLPPANLTVSNVSGAASQAINSANQQPPTDVSTITSTTINNAPNQTMPTLSYLFKNLGNSTVVIKPQSMKGTALNTLSVLKQAATTGACFTDAVITDNSTPGNLDVTITWNHSTCTTSSGTLMLNGTITVTGAYDTTLGDLGITESMNLTFSLDDLSTGTNTTISLNGSDTTTGAGILVGANSISYTDKGKTNISASMTSPNGNSSFTGWIAIDDTFTGTPTQLMYTINDGTEIDVGGSKVVGEYGIANITMTTYSSSGSPITAITVNGSGTYGVAVSGTTYGYSGRINVVYSNLLFDYTTCYGPTGGTITITGAAGNVFVFDFNNQTSCGCASAVTENGTPVSGSFCY